SRTTCACASMPCGPSSVPSWTAKTANAGKPRAPMTNEAARILLVDDDADLLQLIAMRLTAAGYAVTAVESGEAALASFAISRPAAIVTDLRMRGMDGMALFDAIHARAPSLPVVILTAHGTIPEAVAATRRG